MDHIQDKCLRNLGLIAAIGYRLLCSNDNGIVSTVTNGDVHESANILGLSDSSAVKGLQTVRRYLRSADSFGRFSKIPPELLGKLVESAFDLGNQIQNDQFPNMSEAVSEFPELAICGYGTWDRMKMTELIPMYPYSRTQLFVLQMKRQEYTIAGFATQIQLSRRSPAKQPIFGLIKGNRAQTTIRGWAQKRFRQEVDIKFLG